MSTILGNPVPPAIRRLTSGLAIAVLAVACAEPPSAIQSSAIPRADIGPVTPVWTAIDIPPTTGNNRAVIYDVSDNGRAVGYAYHSSGGGPSLVLYRPMYWTQAGGSLPLPMTSNDGTANAISDNGVYAVGQVGHLAARWKFGRGGPTFVSLPSCGPGYAAALSVNNAGVAVGFVGSNAVKWTSDTGCPTLISVSGETMDAATDINDANAIVGVGFSPQRGFMTGSIVLPPKLPALPGDTYSEADGVNDGSEVVGRSRSWTTTTAIYRNPVTGDVIPLGATSSNVMPRISDKSRIIWAAGTGWGGRSSKGTALSFLTIVPYGINTCGDIVGMTSGAVAQLWKKTTCD
jgi:hypothetical protein